MFFLIYIAAFAFYILHMAPSVTVGDAGEFIASAKILGIAHAPGYPFFSLTGKIVSLMIPWGSAAFRVNILSAAAGAAAAAMVYKLIRENLAPDDERFASWTAIGAAAVFASSIAVARSATQTEVFTLNALFASMITWALLSFARGREYVGDTARVLSSGGEKLSRFLYLASFLFGLGTSNHQTIILLLPAAVWLILRERAALLLRRAPILLFFAALGFSLNFYLPIRATAKPALNVGDPSTPRNFLRVLRRADYGTLKLTAGEKPEYSTDALIRQSRRVISGIAREFSVAGAIVILAGAWAIAAGKIILPAGAAGFWFIFYLFAVPFFIFMGNLPFDSESEGILERFYVMGNIPLVFLLAAGAEATRKIIVKTASKKISPEKQTPGRDTGAISGAGRILQAVPAAAIFTFAFFNAVVNRKDFDLRRYFLAHDYGRNVLKTVEPGGALFMDGGDDTFYTTAYFVFAEKLREDVSLFDRGAVVFQSPYGADFRRLARNEKDIRRSTVEKLFAARRPVYFSTFNKDIMGTGGVSQTGILYRAKDGLKTSGVIMDGRKGGGLKTAGNGFFNFYSMRNVFEELPDSRSRALQPIYPFLEASAMAESASKSAGGNTIVVGVAMKSASILDYCLKRWPDVSWLETNAAIEAEHIAYSRFVVGDFETAKGLYEMITRHNPMNHSAWTNLGVVFERMTLDDKALECYARAYRANPGHTAAYYNAAVIYWKRGDWEKVAEFFGRVVEIEPRNRGARGYLEAARLKIIKQPTVLKTP